jgi:PPK2 family polyphosphate:nucleotide phosphotransferase
MTALDPKTFRVRPGHAVDLGKVPTLAAPFYASKDEYRALLQRHVEELSTLQSKLYAMNRYALLIIFQAMDTAGKDGMIKHVMSGVNPQGCQVSRFEHPSDEELEHDFLWRAVGRLPERGHIGIFNRSYYEEVLIVRVHPELLQAEKLPHELMDKSSLWEQRFRSIVDLEHHLHHNGTRVLKFFLHISKEEQRKRLLHRIDDPDKNWKLSMADIEERKFWDQYMEAYEACLRATSTDHAPWFVIPADDKPNAQIVVSEIVLDTLRNLRLSYPQPDEARLAELTEIRKRLAQ